MGRLSKREQVRRPAGFIHDFSAFGIKAGNILLLFQKLNLFYLFSAGII
jgi:hypothetical protein